MGECLETADWSYCVQTLARPMDLVGKYTYEQTEVHEGTPEAFSEPEMNSLDEVKSIARAIEPTWWGKTEWYEPWSCFRHPLDNYPEQHIKYRQRSIDQALKIYKALKELAAKTR